MQRKGKNTKNLKTLLQFVVLWKQNQVELLYDSLRLKYPIGDEEIDEDSENEDF